MNLNVTLVAQAVTFFVFIFFCAKFIWPPLTSAMSALMCFTLPVERTSRCFVFPC